MIIQSFEAWSNTVGAYQTARKIDVVIYNETLRQNPHEYYEEHTKTRTRRTQVPSLDMISLTLQLAMTVSVSSTQPSPLEASESSLRCF